MTPVADPRQLQVHRAPAQRDVPYVPTEPPVVAAMLRMAGVSESDTVYDLGCGDGRILISAVEKYKVKLAEKVEQAAARLAAQ